MASSSVYSAADIEGGNPKTSTGMKWTPSTIAFAALGTILLVFPYVAIPILFAVYKPNAGTNQQVSFSSCNLLNIY